MKITRETVLEHIGYHRTHIDDISKSLGIRMYNSRNRLLYLLKLIKFGWILICLLWEGVIDSDSGDYWKTF